MRLTRLLAESRLIAFAGQPSVLVFARELPSFGVSELAELRAELRGLGAVLFLASARAIQRIGPDDSPETERNDSPDTARALEALFRRYALDPRRMPAHELSVLVLDGAQRVRLRAKAEASRAQSALLSALRLAHGEFFKKDDVASRLSRRELVLASLVGGFMLALAGCKRPLPELGGTPKPAPSEPVRGREISVKLRINGQEHVLELEPRVSLLDALRERLALTGTKKGCDHGQCGACTVLVDGARVNACLLLAVMAEGSDVQTIEGLAKGDELHPMQAAFVHEDALQCGYCTPGQIMSALGLLHERRAATDAEVREHMSGNICRCGAYNNIVRAVQLARKSGAPT